MSHVLMSVPFIDTHDRPTSEKLELIRPPEILCQILHFAVGAAGRNALLPFAHISAQWRRAALGDSSLWSTIYLSQTPPPLLDMALACAGNQGLTVHADNRDLERHAKLWVLADRIEELYYSARLGDLAPFLASLGPAPNLKVLHIRPEPNVKGIEELMTYIAIPTIFSGRLPLLRNLALTHTAVWPAGLFRGLVSFECGNFDHFPLSPTHVLDVIRESPVIESLCLMGRCLPPQEPNQPAISLPLLRKCTLVGDGTTSLIRFITIPTTAVMFLGRGYANDWIAFPEFNTLSVTPGLRVLDEISVISFSIGDHTARLQARNDHGGVLDVEAHGLYDLSGNPPAFISFIRNSFPCWRTCSGLKTIKEFTFCIERDGIWRPHDTMRGLIDVARLVDNLAGIEGAKFRGLPPLELSSILSFFTLFPRVPTFKPQYPNLKRLDIESSPIRSPRLLLVELGKLLAARKEAGAPLQSLTAKVRCEMLIAPTDHCALLTAWEGLVGGVVRLEYERIEVKKLLWRRYRFYPEDHEGRDEEWGREADTGGLSDCVGWDGWPGKWPKTLEEMKG